MLAEGLGVAKDRQAAAEMFEAAAVRHHPLANYNLALLFLAGDGKPENPYRAFLHMRYAAESGVVVAQYGLGTLYASGTGVDANAFEAARWIGKAAVAGYAEAQLDFGVLLFEGRGVPPDPQRGAHMFRQAAEQGLPVAQNRLARCYAHGAGVTMNPGEAARWHLIAKAGGVEDKSLDELFARLSKADRAKAEGAAEAWHERSIE
jgi:TPR repeat protein